MPRIKFVVAHKVKLASGKGPQYAVGQVAELPADSCLHFTSRGLAVDLDDEAEPPAAKGDAADGDETAPPPPPANAPNAPNGGKGGKGGKAAAQ